MKKLLSIFIIACFLTSCSNVPITGRKQLLLFSSSEISSISNLTYKEYMSEVKLSTNKNQTEMIKTVGRNITKAVELYLKESGQTNLLNNMDWGFDLVQSNEVNAFCLPNGKIVFYEGILKYADTPDKIAVVMGHEIGHAIAQHGNERMSQEAMVGAANSALSGILANSNTSDKNKIIFSAAFGLGSKFGVLLPYSRKHEYEADRLGLILMGIAGYDVNKGPEFWSSFGNANANKKAEFFSTHPSDENRVINMKTYIPEAKSYADKYAGKIQIQ